MKKNAYAFNEKHIVDSLDWINKAVGVDEGRFALMHIRVEADCVVAACGRRLHKWSHALGIDVGNYSLIIKTVKGFYDEDCDDFETYPEKAILIESDVDYPDWKKVIPAHEKRVAIQAVSNSLAYVSMKTGVCLNTDYLKDAMGLERLILVKYGKPIEPIVIEYADRQAVIVPLKTPEMEDSE